MSHPIYSSGAVQSSVRAPHQHTTLSRDEDNNNDAWGFTNLIDEIEAIPVPDRRGDNSNSYSSSKKSRRNRSNNNHYNQIHVLLIKWKNDHDFDDELARLAAVFKHDFKCHTVRRLEVPPVDSQEVVESYFDNWLARFSKAKSLLVVYYGGHGGLNAEMNLLWSDGSPIPPPRTSHHHVTTTTATVTTATATLNWSLIQPLLSSAESQVLLLLDCCFASAAAVAAATTTMMKKTQTHFSHTARNNHSPYPPYPLTAGTTVLIAACAVESLAAGPGVQSFTQALIETLRGVAERRTVVSSAVLHGEVLARLVRRRGVGVGRETVTPVVVRLVGGSRAPDILLRSFRPRVAAAVSSATTAAAAFGF